MYPFREFKLGELKNIMAYKYKSIDNSISQKYFLTPMFRFIQKFVPVWITPNQITMIGFVSMLISLIITFVFDKNLNSHPRFLPFANMILLIIYLISDGIDGIHARATGQCSPLGQLLDHGVDSIACFIISLTIGSSLSFGFGKLLIALMINMFSVFYSGILHEKYIGYFKFNYISGCSEGILVACLIHILATLYPNSVRFFDGNLKIFGLMISEKIFYTAFLAAFVMNVLELFYSVVKVLDYSKYYHFAKSMYIPSLLYLLLVSSYGNIISSNSFNTWAILVVFSHSFTSCYVEETLCTLTKSKINNKVIVASYSILAAAILVLSKRKVHIYRTIIILTISTVHFMLLHGSIIYNLCKKMGFNFLKRKL